MKLILLFVLVCAAAGTFNDGSSPGFGPGEQDWGYVDVRPGAHMFYWLFYVQDPKVQDYYDRPLVLWLQGGPGGSSSGFGNFEEIGPLFLNGTERPQSWAKHVNLLFVDNPVGAGFSYVDDYSLLTTTNQQIGADMVSFLTGFLRTYPKFEKSPLYIYCESYGGKMAVEIAKQLHEAVNMKEVNVNFKGVGLGDSWISPVDSVKTWAPFLYYTGMVDEQGFERLKEGAHDIEKALNAGEFEQATELWKDLEVQVITETNNVDFYNVLYKVRKNFVRPYDIKASRNFDEQKLDKLMNGPVKRALNLPKEAVHNKQSSAVFKYLSEDFMKPVVDVVEDLLNNTSLQVTVFTGTLDLIVDTPGTVYWMDNMHWKGAKEWKNAPRYPMTVNGYIEGYVKNVGNLYLYWVLRSGHMVPTDNPDTALEVLRRSTHFDKL